MNKELMESLAIVAWWVFTCWLWFMAGKTAGRKTGYTEGFLAALETEDEE